MASNYHSLASFLSASKHHLASAIDKKSKVTIVTGNQSADLDSFTSSVVYALIRSRSPPSKAFTPLYVPLLNIPAADIELRPEFKALFQHAGIQAADTVNLDDLPKTTRLREELPPDHTRWILVDHNKLEGDLGEVYGRRVHGVIDHHEEENAVPEITDPEPRVVEKCGSCTSLVVHHFLSKSRRSEVLELDPTPAKLALASILIDTKNLSDKSKVRLVDISAAEYLESQILTSDATWDRNTFFTELDTAKKDIESLPLQGILRKDYKQWTEAGMALGMSTVVKPLSFLRGKARHETSHSGSENEENAAWNSVAVTFMQERNLNIWAVMTAFTTDTGASQDGGEFARELCIQWARGGVEKRAVRRFEEIARVELRLEGGEWEEFERGDGGGRVVWRQGNVGKSRKQVGPLLRRAMREGGG